MASVKNKYIGLFALAIIVSTLSLTHPYTYNVYEEGKNELIEFDDKLLIIHDIYDLRGDTLVLPIGGTLLFKDKGQIKNGVLVGNDTEIRSFRNRPIFYDIIFSGSFVGSVHSQWFPLLYGKRVDNSKDLNSALELAYLSSEKVLCLKENRTLYVKSDIPSLETKDFLRHGTVEVKSGVCFDLNGSTLKCLPNNSKAYNIIFSRQAKDIIIRNGVICGDLKKHLGNKGEWGYGIELQGVQGFILENLECKYCWGDGINIQVAFDGDGNQDSDLTRQGHCSDGVISNVYCHHNRRQGMSVEGIIGLKVVNSQFSYTDGTNPRSGIDIEPYSYNNLVRNVIITNCVFKNNAYSGILMMGSNVSDITIDNCRFHNSRHFDLTLKGKNINVLNCQYPLSIRLVDDCSGVAVLNSKIKMFQTEDFSNGSFIKEISFTCSEMLYGQKHSNDYIFADCRISYENCIFK